MADADGKLEGAVSGSGDGKGCREGRSWHMAPADRHLSRAEMDVILMDNLLSLGLDFIEPRDLSDGSGG